jgi:hypothetical protein
MKEIILGLIMISLVACSPSPQTMQATISETRAPIQDLAAETQTARSTSLAGVNLEPVLFQSGDLPAQYKSGQIAYRWPDGLPLTYFPDNLILQKVGQEISQTFEDDYLMVALYDSKDRQEKAWQDIVDYFSDKPGVSAGVGDQATYITISDTSGRALLVFTHCSALVAMDITGADMSKDLLEAFAQRLDERLEPLVCKP